MEKIYNLFLVAMLAICRTSCNNEWGDEQFRQLVSFKATINGEGVSSTYVRYKPGDMVARNLLLLLSGPIMSTNVRTVHVVPDPDTLKTLNLERFDKRRSEPHYQMSDQQYYTMPETVDIPAGEYVATLPINSILEGENNANSLDMSDKYTLPLTIIDNPSYDYQPDDRLHYRKALLNTIPSNDYSGTYGGNQSKITLEGQEGPFTAANCKTYMHDDSTVFVYMGLRDADYIDHRYYKLYMELAEEEVILLRYKLRLWTDNGGTGGNNFKKLNGKIGNVEYEQPYYTVIEEHDTVKPYLKHTYITLYLAYTLEDHTLSPGNRLKYIVESTPNMQRDLNTLVPNEDRQIQWDQVILDKW